MSWREGVQHSVVWRDDKKRFHKLAVKMSMQVARYAVASG